MGLILTSPNVWQITSSTTIAPFSNSFYVGIGIQTPTSPLHVQTDWGGSASTQLIGSFDSYADVARFTFRRANGTVASPTQVTVGQTIGNLQARGYQSGGAFATQANCAINFVALESFTATAQGSGIDFYTTAIGTTTLAAGVRITPAGDILLDPTLAGAPTANAGRSIIFTDHGATKPTLATNTAAIYARDVAGTVEVHVEDEAGNETQISPHNFTKIPRSEDMAWSFYSERGGKYITADMTKALRVLERLSGEKLVFSGKI